ncbi:phosphatases II [Artomyces pyxidatus]|uniref:Phosphatases II n=1 Tax=Artomyces pyxidatus TaxID=48021 RepID=A0ACB8T705_9AGAM|nr:phosphatases II [Artomyces pyxidatus]
MAPYLYLGPCSAASSQAFVSAEGITHILSIGSTPVSKLPDIIYERLPLTDCPTSTIASISEGAKVFIDTAKAGGGRVLVHCSAAISRSPTIVAAYLMQSEGLTLKAALGRIVRARPTVSPNTGFLEQLKAMEVGLFGVGTLAVDALPRRREDREAMFIE